jgi:hypothetical protein
LRVNSTSGGISAVKGPAAPHQKYTYWKSWNQF